MVRSASGTAKKDKGTRRAEQQVRQRSVELQRQQARSQSKRRNLLFRVVGGILALAAVATALLYATRGTGGGASTVVAATLGPPTSTVPSPPVGNFTHVGATVRQHGKPLFLFVGAQYCPHCAGQRWAIVKALDQFGSFSGVRSSTNGDGTIPTFDLEQATYTSPYIVFDHKDLEDRNYKPLDTLTSGESALYSKYDPSGGIPLVLVGGYDLIGDGYDLSTIQNLSFTTVQHGLQTNGHAAFVSQINGEVNTVTAIICHADGMKPAGACGRPVVRRIASTLH